MKKIIEFPYLGVHNAFIAWEETTITKIYKVWYISDDGYITYMKFLDGLDANEYLNELRKQGELI